MCTNSSFTELTIVNLTCEYYLTFSASDMRIFLLYTMFLMHLQNKSRGVRSGFPGGHGIGLYVQSINVLELGFTHIWGAYTEGKLTLFHYVPTQEFKFLNYKNFNFQ